MIHLVHRLYFICLLYSITNFPFCYWSLHHLSLGICWLDKFCFLKYTSVLANEFFCLLDSIVLYWWNFISILTLLITIIFSFCDFKFFFLFLSQEFCWVKIPLYNQHSILFPLSHTINIESWHCRSLICCGIFSFSPEISLVYSLLSLDLELLYNFLSFFVQFITLSYKLSFHGCFAVFDSFELEVLFHILSYIFNAWILFTVAYFKQLNFFLLTQ